jgi:dUTP pyrophosphatase
VAVALQIKLLDLDLPRPARGFAGDAGLDLCARADTTLSSATGPQVISTGIAVAIPEGQVGLVCSRSGLAAEAGLAVFNAPGIIDAGYRGEIQVIMFAVSKRPYIVRRGMRIAQLIVVALGDSEVEFVDSLAVSERGERGLGSTGEISA